MKSKTHKIWTIGHSTRSIEEFIEILKSFKIELLADIRSFQGSRKFTHFNKENITAELNNNGIEYLHIKELGGRRKISSNSKNTTWRNSAFRGYADYMETADFLKGINILTEAAEKGTTAIMCAEAVWWRCHRSLISDYLKLKNWTVIHIVNKIKEEVHPYTNAAKVIQGELFYNE